MIVMFGDHQPSVEDEFYDDIAGMPSSEVPAQEHLMWYETPFIIWTNYSMPSGNMGRLGAVYLSSEVLWRANLEMTPYNRFLLAMREELPVVHPLGCYDREGTYYYWAKAESERCPYQDTVLDYEEYFKLRADEEYLHHSWIRKYLNENDAEYIYPTIDQFDKKIVDMVCLLYTSRCV